MGFLDDTLGAVTGGILGSKPSSGDATSSAYGTQQVETRARPSEFDTMFNEFMNQYLGIDPNIQNEINAIQAKIDQTKAILPSRYARSSHKGHNAQLLIDDLEKQKLALQSKMNETAGPGYKEALGTYFGEQGIADKQYVDAMSNAWQPHSALLSDIINKQMAGEAVGPYGADIDQLLTERAGAGVPVSPYDAEMRKLLGERSGISFGGGAPMQFITGSQQRLLSDLLGQQTSSQKIISDERQKALSDFLKYQESGIEQMRGMSKERSLTDLLPAQAEFDLFKPSNAADIAYMQDLRSFIEPMEYVRMGVTPSVSGSSSATASPLQAQQLQAQTISQQLGNLSSLLNLGAQIGGMMPGIMPSIPDLKSPIPGYPG